MSRPVKFDNIVIEICEELNDPNWIGCLHGTNETIPKKGAKRCSGPLCRKHRRDLDRRRKGKATNSSPGEEFLAHFLATYQRKVLIERAIEKSNKVLAS